MFLSVSSSSAIINCVVLYKRFLLFKTISMFLIILLMCFLTSIYLYTTSTYGYWKKKGIKYIKPIPLIGNMLDIFTFKKSSADFFQEVYNKYQDDYIGIWSFKRPCLVVKNLDTIKNILIKHFVNFKDRSNVTNVHKDPLGGNNLFFINDPPWKSLRAKLTPFFTSSRMRSMFGLLDKVGVNLVDYIDDKIGNNESIIDVKTLYGHFTTDSIVSIAFGIEGNSFTDSNSIIRKFSRQIFHFDLKRAFEATSLLMAPDLVPIFNFHVFGSKVTQAITDMILKIFEDRKKSNIKRNDLIDILNELKDQNIDDEGKYKFQLYTLVSQAATFFSAGFETTRNALSFLTYELAKNPEIQKRLSNEIELILKESNGMISYEGIQKMTYLDMCLKETLRMYPPLPFLDRVCENKYRIKETDLIIDPGTIIYIPVYSIHMNPTYFPEPEVFNPERFSPENTIASCVYMPFGSGPRNCIGERLAILNTKIGMVHVMRNFKIETCEKTVDKITFNPKSTIINSLHGIELKFVKRY